MLFIKFGSAFLMFMLPLVAILVPIWIGQKIGLRSMKMQRDIPEGPVSSVVSSTLALSAFMLAFTFNIVGNRYDKRKELLVEEMAEIKVAYQQAGLVPEPFRSLTRSKIITYVDLRVELQNDLRKFPEIKKKSLIILDTLWNYAEQLAVIDRSSEAYSLYTASMSNLARLINKRIVLTGIRINKTILYAMCIVTFISMIALGFQFGASGKTTRGVMLLLAGAFATVMWLIFALDNPESGLIPLSDKPLMNLYEELHGK